MLKQKKGETKTNKEETPVQVDLDKFATTALRSLNGNKGKSFFDLTKDDPCDVKLWIPTGSTLLDYGISNRRNGGIPAGRITEISGLKGTGKSLLAFHAVKNTQKLGGIAFYMDTEHALTTSFMKRQGVNLKRCIYSQPSTIEKTFEQIQKIIIYARDKLGKDIPVTIVWDSIAATKPQVEVEGTFDPNERIGVAAKAMSKGMRILTETVGYEKVTLLLLNQLRTKIGVMFGDPLVTPGGHAVDFHASVQIRLEKVGGKVKMETGPLAGEVVGEGVKATVVKSRFGPNFRTVRFKNMYDYGPDDASSIYEMLHDKKVIDKVVHKGYSTIILDGKEDMFRAKEWKTKLRDPEFKSKIDDLVETLMVREYQKEEDTDVVKDAIVVGGE